MGVSYVVELNNNNVVCVAAGQVYVAVKNMLWDAWVVVTFLG